MASTEIVNGDTHIILGQETLYRQLSDFGLVSPTWTEARFGFLLAFDNIPETLYGTPRLTIGITHSGNNSRFNRWSTTAFVGIRSRNTTWPAPSNDMRRKTGVWFERVLKKGTSFWKSSYESNFHAFSSEKTTYTPIFFSVSKAEPDWSISYWRCNLQFPNTGGISKSEWDSIKNDTSDSFPNYLSKETLTISSSLVAEPSDFVYDTLEISWSRSFAKLRIVDWNCVEGQT